METIAEYKFKPNEDFEITKISGSLIYLQEKVKKLIVVFDFIKQALIYNCKEEMFNGFILPLQNPDFMIVH